MRQYVVSALTGPQPILSTMEAPFSAASCRVARPSPATGGASAPSTDQIVRLPDLTEYQIISQKCFTR
ncbi:hypothetical protein [Pseudomonas phage Poseidon]|uniref:Uncharacterized protein n=10 Tax=Pbunavirus PB1 TaxID=2006179 RepID=A0A0S1WGH3_9CAUD|nr:hypothetical protein PB1_gp91 [Pseudomonas phage PB1]ALM62256.1 hypothetical protein [Pseudomonas phage Gallinipper]ALM62344.1 hypothetical protein [Pseudomonas phage Jollyroger]ALM62433.1 hypothetical protein [Pseudomonas phage Kraken]ALM62521.1 hypothetical protein [Pseudomonas phage Kula]ALM62609.1 hypothetical protein [Pseudomonas phage Nemo]ALM62696.1 hypothetical protein [Pseudomonas phage Nessie]ALM62784.1 hypothetical protein [Pseudomonas phage Poseidon]ALM62871.1 hypothetical pr